MRGIKIRLRYLFLIVSIVLMLTGVLLASHVQTSGGAVLVQEVDFLAADGSNIHATLQQPTFASESNKLPGVIVFHGSLQNKEWLMAFGIELARRGFVVLTPDANGHGNSDDGTGSGSAALDYLSGLASVDSSRIGLVGHSMGGGTAAQALRDSDVDVQALVLVGSWVQPTWNASYPRNLLITVGDFDSLFAGRDLSQLDSVFNTTEIQEGTLYGDFELGTARKYVLARTNHLFETIDPEIVSETVEWMKESLGSDSDEAHWIPSNDLIYGWWIAGGFLGTLGAILTIFPVLTLLLETRFFEALRANETPSQESASIGPFSRWGLVYSIIPPLTFFPLLAIGSLIPFPQRYGTAIMTWFIGMWLILLLLLRRTNDGKTLLGRISKEWNQLPKAFAVSLLVILWLYGWTLLVDLGFALDFRAFLPGMNDLTAFRALFVPIYAIVLFLYFLIDGIWLMGPLKPKDVQPWYKGQALWSLSAMILKCYPFVLLIAYEFGLGMLLGVSMVPGMIGYSFLFFYAFTPWLAVSAVITVWAYRETGTFHLGAFINALLFAWMIATILSF